MARGQSLGHGSGTVPRTWLGDSPWDVAQGLSLGHVPHRHGKRNSPRATTTALPPTSTRSISVDVPTAARVEPRRTLQLDALLDLDLVAGRDPARAGAGARRAARPPSPSRDPPRRRLPGANMRVFQRPSGGAKQLTPASKSVELLEVRAAAKRPRPPTRSATYTRRRAEVVPARRAARTRRRGPRATRRRARTARQSDRLRHPAERDAWRPRARAEPARSPARSRAGSP